MITVELKDKTTLPPLVSASHAARGCYSAKKPKIDGKLLNVEGQLFNVGHHTTLEHTFFSFWIEGIAVGDVTFGLHLNHPFYNTDQRSGRFCAEMFSAPDYAAIENYIREFWPGANHEIAMSYICESVDIFQTYLPFATKIAECWIKEDRPFASKHVRASAQKIAQEQLRMFIPLVFPTGLTYSIDLITLASMHKAAWNPVIAAVTGEMADLVMREFPETSFMFRSGPGIERSEWHPEIRQKRNGGFLYSPELDFLRVNESSRGLVIPESHDKHPVDLLRFHPKFMNNSVATVFTEVSISCATMGQDQRHRTIERGEPCFTSEFYIPPIVAELGLDATAGEMMDWWIAMKKAFPPTLWAILAPYGAVVNYEKRSSLNALAHEQAKRLCWCAQEEIYHLGRKMWIALREQEYVRLANLFPPHCFFTGICAEGARFCGRDRRIRRHPEFSLRPELYFPERRI